MALEKQLADTDSVYCTKVTNSNQSSIFISNLGAGELDVLFGANYKSDDAVRLRLNKRNLAFNAVSHVVDGRAWYKRKSSEKWNINAVWLKDRLSDLADAFNGDECVFVAYLNKDDHSTQRLYMKGMTSLPREDGEKNIALRDFLFSGDVVVLTKLENGDVFFEVKIPDDPVISYASKSEVDEQLVMPDAYQLIIYGAPGTGKSKQTKDEVAGHLWYRTTFHPDSDYASFVGAYKPMMKEDGVALTEVSMTDAAGQPAGKEVHDQRKGIAYGFVDQVFTKAYVEAWKRQKNAAADATPEPVFLVIEEINRGNCAQIFGDIFQLLDRNGKGFSEYPVEPDSDLGRFIAAKIAEDPSVIVDDRKTAINALYPEAEFDVVEKVLKGEQLLLPGNLFIRATMNTSDQSLFPMDSAFKRRWDWKYVPICQGLDKDTKQPLCWKIKFGDCEVDWWEFLVAINRVVKGVTNSADKQMGYFFVRAKDSVIDAEMFVNKVAFYLWNDVFKDCELDGDAFKITREGGEVDVLAFQDFFKEDGAVNEEVLKDFLTALVPSSVAAPGSGETSTATGAGT